ncbi:MAG: hypothetical protein QNK23_12820 [Crocinitomicaceae bacterium]|nr:hypothetical protein [Crocinitomicaceae bacterium]
MRSNSSIRIDHFPQNCDTIVNKNNRVFVLQMNDGNNNQLIVVSAVGQEWYQWNVPGSIYDGFSAEIQLITISGISEPLIYMRWSDSSRGSGMGEVYSGKILWDRAGRRCYFEIIDKCTHYEHDKYGDNPTYKTYNYHFYCKVRITQEGLEITENNTCEHHYDPIGSGIEGASEMVGKYIPGIYIFDRGQFRLK